MSRTHGHGTGPRTPKSGKGWGYEYWSSRPPLMGSPGKITKKITHSIERARKRQELDLFRKEEQEDSN